MSAGAPLLMMMAELDRNVAVEPTIARPDAPMFKFLKGIEAPGQERSSHTSQPRSRV